MPENFRRSQTPAVGAEFKRTAPNTQKAKDDESKESVEYFKKLKEMRNNSKSKERTVQKIKVSGRMGSSVKVQYAETVRINPAWHMLCRKMQVSCSLQEKKGIEAACKTVSKLARSIEI